MISNRIIVCLASNWFYDPTSKHHIMRLLARDNHVIWVNYHASRRPALTPTDFRAAAGKLRQFIEGPRRVSPNMTVITPLVIPLPGNAAARRLNAALLTRQIRHVIRGLPRRPVQLWTFAPDVDYLCGRFGEECVVYYCVDEFSQFTGYNRDAVLMAEKRLCARADMVIATSKALHQCKATLCKRIELITHGVDHAHFSTALPGETEIPADMMWLARPVFGFWGLIQDWFDAELVASVAAARPNWSLVLIGEVATNVAALRPLPNVHFIGRRPYAELPAYARSFDAGLIPFRINELTRAVNPIKLREYLSAGLPVVSTPLPEVERYREHLEIASTPEEFAAACERALTRNSGSLASAAMLRETWEEKLKEISRHVCEVTNSVRV